MKNIKFKIIALLLLLLILILFLVPTAYQFYKKNSCGEIKISEVLITNDKTNILIYARVSGITEDIKRAILAGVPTTFTFRIEFYEDKKYRIDKRLAQIEIKKHIKYDRIKKTFYLTSNLQKTVEGFQEFDLARLAITEINGIPVTSIKNLKDDHKYYAKIKLEWENYQLPFYAEFIRIFLSLKDFETDWYYQPFHFQK
ncbi:MAG: hypothetical protein A4E66_01263 [Syntrophus sp. PtaB.Bin001]|nr:MAG: hypothetical protein A4E66_01263 [Syntrophus sp. PtaB.Bin001]